MSASQDRAVVALIATGGTISSLGTTPLDLMDYPEFGTRLPLAGILARVPQAAEQADLVCVDYKATGSTALAPADWFALRAHIRRLVAARPDLAGVVVTHGTATLEETAFFLDLTLDIGPAVVLVGAQRPLGAVGSDAPLNLVNAIRVAADPASRGRGVLVLLNDEIHAARDVAKSATLRVQAFRSPDFGMLGVADPDGIHYYRRVDRARPAIGPIGRLADDVALPRVDIVYAYAGADGALVEAAVAHGARGLVSAGMAPGSPARGQRAAFDAALKAGIAVVQCAHVGSGRVAHRRALLEGGYVSGGDLNPQKARILLALALAAGEDAARLFATV